MMRNSEVRSYVFCRKPEVVSVALAELQRE
jgi:hypothetical protein